MTAKQTSVRIELFKITCLIVLLGAGGLYIAHIGGAGTLFNTDAFPLEDPGDYQAHNRTFTGQAMPLLTAHEASTGRKEVVSFDTEGVVLLISGTARVQQKVSALRQAQALYESIEKDIPIRVVFLTNDDEKDSRYKTLLLRKAVRPTFEIWYAGNTSMLAETVLSERLYSALIVQNNTIRSIFHAGNHDGILREIYELRATS